MGLFDWFKKKKSPLGSFIERDSKGRWIEVTADKSSGCCGGGKCACGEPSVISAEKVIKITKATTDAKPTTIPKATPAPRNVKSDMDKIEADVEKRRVSKLEQVKADAERMATAKAKSKPHDGDGDGNDKKNETKAPAKKPVSKSQEKRVAIQKDVAETPTPVKKVVKKSVAPKSVTKPAPKATGEVKKATPKKK